MSIFSSCRLVVRKRSRPLLSKSEQMARVRSRNTATEMAFRKLLWARGLRYRLYAPLPGTPDLVFRRARVAVFIDGCFWHGCPRHYRKPAANAEFWQSKLQRNVERDRRVNRKLRTQGWRVVRVWGHSLDSASASRVAELVWNAVRVLS